MKKLLITAIGAAAAFGAVAGEISRQAIGEISTGVKTDADELDAAATPSGTYWSDPADVTNTYTVSTLASVGQIATPFSPISGKALDIKTTFGKPLSVDMVSGGTPTNIPASGIYFDSLVKFTVCEDTPTETYDGAKIVMWLQEQYDGNENITGTNLMVRAGYLSYNAGALPPVSVTPTNYVCTFGINGATGDFADKWHRVTIKAIPDITTSQGVPGFAIYIDGSGTALLTDVSSTQDKWDSSFDALTLTEGAKWLNDSHCLFPSMVQSGGAVGSLTAASFDGTGSITDIVFTDEPMAFAADYVAPKAVITIDDVPYGSETGEYTDLATAIAALNGITSATEVEAKFTLQRDVAFDGDLTINNADEDVTIVIDLAGKVLTIDNLILNSPVRITDSSVAKTGMIVGDIFVNRNEVAGEMTLLAGTIDGYIDGTCEEEEPVYRASVFLMGGTVKQNDIDPVAGYVLEQVGETDFYNVVEYVAPTYTITVAGGEHFTVAVTTNGFAAGAAGAYVVTEGGSVAVTYTADTGYTLSKYSDSIASVDDDATIAAPTATLQTFKVIFNDGELSTTNVVDYGSSSVGVVPEFAGRTGYTAAWDNDPTAVVSVTSDLTFTAVYTANTYTVTFYTNSAEYATATYTYGDASTYTAPTDPSVSGYTFGGWYTDNGTFNTAFVFSANVAGNTQVAYAKLTSSGPAPIDPTSGTPSTVVEAESAAAAISAATIAAPTGVDAAAYKSNFDFEAKSNGDGTYTVTMTGIKESVETAVENSAMDILEGKTGAKVQVPAGLYYKVTTYTALGGAAVSTASEQSDGTGVTVAKPGTTQGFIKVEMATVPFN